MKATKITYWVLTTLFCLMMLMDGISGIMQVEGGREPMEMLGYPLYMMVILGIFKVAGALAIFQTRFIILKEWAYAGFTINYLGACMSWIAVKNYPAALFPVIALGILFLTYYFWKRYLKMKNTPAA